MNRPRIVAATAATAAVLALGAATAAALEDGTPHPEAGPLLPVSAAVAAAAGAGGLTLIRGGKGPTTPPDPAPRRSPTTRGPREAPPRPEPSPQP